MLIDMHAHTSGISTDCLADMAQVLQVTREAGIEGLVLTNHYQESFVTDGDAAAFAQRYVAEYEAMKRLADAVDFPLFFGVEVTAKLHGNAHILLYGVGPELVLAHPEIYTYPLEKMARIVHEAGGLVVQAHPFRAGGRVLNPAWLDGIEVNCHPLYDSTHCGELLEIATREGLLVTCGGDYHGDAYRAVCGVQFPRGMHTMADLVDYLKSTPEIRLHVHELRETEHADVVFCKP